MNNDFIPQTIKEAPLVADVKNLDFALDRFQIEVQRNGLVSKEIYEREDKILAQLKLLQAPIKAVYVGSNIRLGVENPTVDRCNEYGNFLLIYLEDGTVLTTFPVLYRYSGILGPQIGLNLSAI